MLEIKKKKTGIEKAQEAGRGKMQHRKTTETQKLNLAQTKRALGREAGTRGT